MDIICECVAGSHLFGLNTEKSDKDFKGVYMPSLEELLLGTYKDSIHTSTNPTNSKNTKNDVDIEFYSLPKFFRMLEEGQTVAFELLFAPEDKILKTSEMWKAIQSNSHNLVHKKVTAFLGYAKQQADKYGLRGSRMGSLETVIAIITSNFSPYQRLEDNLEVLKETTKLAHVEFIDKYLDGRQYYMVCSKKFDLRSKISDVIESLTKTYDQYGERSRSAKQNEGIDWKALSHAVRVMYQGQELLQTGKMSLPFTGEKKQTLMDIKAGKLDYINVVQPLIESEMENLTKAKESSILPETINTKQLLLDIYKEYYNLGE